MRETAPPRIMKVKIIKAFGYYAFGEVKDVDVKFGWQLIERGDAEAVIEPEATYVQTPVIVSNKIVKNGGK